MSDASPPEPPKLYLATPRQIDPAEFAPVLESVLDAVEVACLRLALDSRDEDALCHAGDLLREVCHARDIPLVIEDHFRLVERVGLDGVHLTDGPRRVRDVRKMLGRDAIIGAFCGLSRHAGLTAGEIGADYVSFGPLTASPLLGDGETVDPAIFAWWSEMIEIPVVAEGGLTEEILAQIAGSVDFYCLSDEIWAAPDGPVSAARRLTALV